MARRANSGIPAPSDLLERIAAEIEQRMQELRPAVEERDELLRAATALGIDVSAARPSRKRSRRRGAPRSAVQQAIVAALEHGSHTLAELALVTAHPASGLRRQLSVLLDGGAVERARREGKRAYALARAAD